MFLGATPEGTNREVSTVLECAALVNGCVGRKEGLGIPETALMRLAMRHIEIVQRKGASGTKKKVYSKNVLKGIQASLKVIVDEHMQVLRRMEKEGSVDDEPLKPQASENLEVAAIDPYAVAGYQCELCLRELANAYYHCVGCEEHLDKDFNICAACYANKEFRIHRQMSVRQNFPSSMFSHTGGLEGASIRTRTKEPEPEPPRNKKKAPRNKKKAPQNKKKAPGNKKKAPGKKRKEDKSEEECDCKQMFCQYCKHCTKCSCKCHDRFKACVRFMTIEKEQQLSETVARLVGKDKVDHADETYERLLARHNPKAGGDATDDSTVPTSPHPSGRRLRTKGRALHH